MSFPRLVAVATACFVVSCAARRTPLVLETTSAEWREARRDVDEATAANVNGRHDDALALATHAWTIAPTDARAAYTRGVALRHLGDADAAVAAYRRAEELFHAENDVHGEMIAIYGIALALDETGRCTEAAIAYRRFAMLVQAAEPAAAAAAIERMHRCAPVPEIPVDLAMVTLAVQNVGGHYRAALDASELAGIAARSDGWWDYNRAVAFAGLHLTDEAVSAYVAAEKRFGPLKPREQGIAAYGRARVLDDAGRCREALLAYAEYADIVHASDPEGAAMAMEVARGCVP